MAGAIINIANAGNAVTISVTCFRDRSQCQAYPEDNLQSPALIPARAAKNRERNARPRSRGPNGFSLVLVTKVTARGNVRHVTETLTRLGRATTRENFAKHDRERWCVAAPRGTAAPAQAAPRRDGPVLDSHSAASTPSTVANADGDGDVEMTEASATEVALLNDETMRRIKVTLAEPTRNSGLRSSGPRRLVQRAGQAPPAIGVKLLGTAVAAAPPSTIQQIRLAVQRVAPGVRVIAFRRAGTVQNAEQPPPYTAADEARLNAARAHAIARRE